MMLKKIDQIEELLSIARLLNKKIFIDRALFAFQFFTLAPASCNGHVLNKYWVFQLDLETKKLSAALF